MRVLNRGTDIKKELHALPHRESLRVAPARDRLAAHKFEGKPRSTFRGHATIDEARKIGMREACKDAPLTQKPCMHIIKIVATPNQLDRDSLGEVRTFAYAAIDDTHAATADALGDPKWAEQAADQGVIGIL